MSKNGISKELERKLEGVTDPMEVAAIVSRYNAKQTRERSAVARKREFIESILGSKTGMTTAKADALVWEFSMDNGGKAFLTWLGINHPELVRVDDGSILSIDTGNGDLSR